MFFDQTFVIYHDSGKTEIVDDLYTHIRQTGDIRRFHSFMKYNLGPYKKADDSMYGYTSWWYSRPIECNHVGFYLYTESGLMVSPDLLFAEYNKKYNEGRRQICWNRVYWTRPMTTAGNKHTRTVDKRPHNQQARRMAAGVVKEEGEPPFRGARSHKELRTHWDEVQVRRSCSWKNCTKRKKQYKGS